MASLTVQVTTLKNKQSLLVGLYMQDYYIFILFHQTLVAKIHISSSSGYDLCRSG